MRSKDRLLPLRRLYCAFGDKKELATDLRVAPAEVIACGDYPNDLPMLAWAGRSIAPSNAHPDVLAEVDEVTALNDDDGVAPAIERLLLSGGSADWTGDVRHSDIDQPQSKTPLS